MYSPRKKKDERNGLELYLAVKGMIEGVTSTTLAL